MKKGLRIGCLLLAILLAAVGYYFSDTISDRLSFGEPLLTINSSPTGAMVYVDNGEVGLTPLLIATLNDGPHTVRLTKDQYSDFEKTVFLQRSKTTRLNIDLTPLPFGDVKVSSEPSGATVLLSGEEMGTTPITLKQLAKGSQQITLKKKGFESWKGTAEIISLQIASLHGNLTNVYGSLKVTSTPNNVRVFLDSWEVGITPYFSDQIRKGKHIIELHRAGYKSWKSDIVVSLETPSVLNVDLETSSGSLAITSIPMAAEVFLDGENVGQTPMILGKVAKGSHIIEIKHKDCFLWTKEITLKSGMENKLFAELQTLYGILNISSKPSGANVFLDGQEKGKTPYNLKQIKEGQYTLELKHKVSDKWKKKITIYSEKELNIAVNLVSRYGAIQISSVPSDATVFLGGIEVGRTPFSSDEILKGRHHIELKLNDYDNWQGEIQVRGGENAKLNKELFSLYGGLKIVSKPGNAIVFIDGQKSGTTPFQLNKIIKGQHSISLQHDGYHTWHGKLLVKSGAKEMLSQNLFVKGLSYKIKGSWSGRVWQNLFKVSDVTVQIATDHYHISYPSLDCGGELILLSQTAEQVKFREKITYGGCYDGGHVIISNFINDTIECQWLNRNGKKRFETVLGRNN